MADKKISALTAATTPLAGTEVLPIVQGGATVKVAVSDLTAGRAVATGNVTTTGTTTISSNAAIGTITPNVNANRNTLTLQGSWGGEVDITVGAVTHARFGTDNFSSGYSCRVESQDSIILKTGAASNVLVDTANFLVGASSTSFGQSGFLFLPGYSAAGNSGAAIQHINGSASGSNYLSFIYNAGQIGNISQNGTTGVLYNLTSDYRLKDDPQPLTGSKDFIMALQPKKWQWWDGSGEGVGFIAHEFMEVAKYSGIGKKDEMRIEKYEISPAIPATDNSSAVNAVMGEREVPVYQAIQPSSAEVIANLVSFIQELRTEFDEYKLSHP